MGVALTILFEHERFVVVDKPAGLLSVPGPSRGSARGRAVADVLAAQGVEALPVHRLDRDVSGCLLCVRAGQDRAAREALEGLFRERAIAKVYRALCRGVPTPTRGELREPLLEEAEGTRVSARGKPAATRYRVLAEGEAAAELDVLLLTGRKNQIRVHLAHRGHPLLGERRYARGKDDPCRAPRVMLHAARLVFASPFGGEEVRVEASPPADYLRVRERLGLRPLPPERERG